MVLKELDEDLLQRASAVHERIVTIDGHLDVLGPLTDPTVDGDTQFDFPKAAKGALNGAVLAVHATAGRIDDAAYANAGIRELEGSYDRIRSIGTDYPEIAGIATSPESFRSIVRDGKLAVVVGFQNAGPFLGDVSKLEAFLADRNISMAALTHIGNNDWADSSRQYGFVGGARFANGLTIAGRAAIQMLNEHGIMVDVSQLSSNAFRDVLDVTDAPIVASHSGVKALVESDRNCSDDELKQIAATGGIVNIVGFSGYLVPRNGAGLIRALIAVRKRFDLGIPSQYGGFMTLDDVVTQSWSKERFDSYMEEYHGAVARLSTRASCQELAASIEYAADLVGIEHVGIASDFNHGGGLTDWAHAGDGVNITVELLRRGFSESDVAAVWGGNFLRVWGDIQNRVS